MPKPKRKEPSPPGNFILKILSIKSGAKNGRKFSANPTAKMGKVINNNMKLSQS